MTVQVEFGTKVAKGKITGIAAKGRLRGLRVATYKFSADGDPLNCK